MRKSCTKRVVVKRDVYANGEGNVAAAVRMLPQLSELHRGWILAHMSLGKQPGRQWKEMWKIVANGDDARDWTQIRDSDLWYSPSADMTRKTLFWTTPVQAGIHLQTKPS